MWELSRVVAIGDQRWSATSGEDGELDGRSRSATADPMWELSRVVAIGDQRERDYPDGRSRSATADPMWAR